MLTKFILQQFAAAHKLPLATEHDVNKATAKYINFYSTLN